MIRIREGLAVAASMASVLAILLACKPKSSSTETTSSSSAPSGTLAPSKVTPCTESTKEAHGSLHAEVAWGAPFDAPKSKKKQAYTCGSREASALFLEYATAAQASSMCDFTGPQLWGGLEPTNRDPDELMTKDGSLVIISGDDIDDLSSQFEKDGYVRWRGKKSAGTTTSIDKELAGAVDCGPLSKDPLRAWCPAASYATSGFTTALVPTTYVGITAAVKSGTPVKSALLSDVTVSALTIGPGKARVTSIKPDNENEKKELAATAVAIASALRNDSAGPIHVGKGLAGFLDGLKTDLPTKGYAVTSSAGKPESFTGATPSEIAFVTGKVDAYVVIEHPNDGTWVNVYPARKYVP